MTVITLTSDFGLSDSYVGVMKGVISGIAPTARLVDLTHEIAPQNIPQAAYILAHSAPYFPPGTVHLAIVDPGVGSARRGLLVTTGRATYVGPDNGIFTHALLEREAQAWELDQPRFWLPRVSRTFHGRDIFAPVAAHSASGILPEELGHPIDDPVRLEQAAPARHADGHLSGVIVYVDRYGNLVSNVPAAWIEGGRWRCDLQGAGRSVPLVDTYAQVEVGAVLGLLSSGDTIEIAVRNGNAAHQLGVGVGTEIEVRPTK
jgi:S-adenosylmethionine hydrolase